VSLNDDTQKKTDESFINIGELHKKDLEIARAEVAKHEFEKSEKSQKKYAWIVLSILVLANISSLWQRSLIAVAYSLKPDDGIVNNKMYMSQAIPNFGIKKYSLLAGAAFTMVFATTVLFSGLLADKVSRKWLLCLAAMLWSCTSIASGLSAVYWQLCLFRILLAVFEACLSPTAYSLIADFFPPEKRTVANSVFSVGLYLGSAMANLSINFIKAFGWRGTYILTGFFGIAVSIAGILVIREPPRGVYQPKKIVEEEEEREAELEAKGEKQPKDDDPEPQNATNPNASIVPAQPLNEPPKPNILKQYAFGCVAMFRNKTCMWLTIGAIIRCWQTYTLSYYNFAYFSATFNMDALYGSLNAVAILFGGVASSLLSGYISDKYEPVNYRTKSYVCVFTSLVAVPIIAVTYTTSFSFYFSVTFVFLEYLLAEGWIPPTLSMILACIDPMYKGLAVGIFLFATSMSGTFVIWLDAKLVSSYPDQLGTIITLTTTIPCFLSAFCFWKAGFPYEKFKQMEEKKTDVALEKVEVYHVTMEQEAIISLMEMNVKKMTLDCYNCPESPFHQFTSQVRPTFIAERKTFKAKRN
jgi:MFS family permease